MNAINKANEEKSIVIDINSILEKHGIAHRVLREGITITDKVVSDGVIDGSALSEAIIEKIWPSIRQETVYHYTTSDCAQEIASSGGFRLSCLSRRYRDKEVVDFCEVHGLKGYLELENGIPKYRNLILANTFYASFTSTALDEDDERYFWREFGKGAGARFTIKVTSTNQNFRKIVYGGIDREPIPVLRDLSETIGDKYHRHFTLAGISRLCAFYLPVTFGKEYERRAVYRVWAESGISASFDGSHEYLQIPFGKMHDTGFQLDLVEIQSDDNVSVPPGVLLTRRSEGGTTRN